MNDQTPTPTAASGTPFRDAVEAYAVAGWPAILPVPPATKTPPPTGYTGAEGRDTDPHTLATWAVTHAASSVALRMPMSGPEGPGGVVGIDVDSYVKGAVTKRGAETFAAYVDQWGALPPTWTSTARGAQGPSRIYFFQVPPGRYATRLSTGETGDVEVIQRHHRYAVVWPSPHPGAGEGAVYRWYDPTGALAAPGRVPSPAELPWLPQAWVDGLAAGAAAASGPSADRASGSTLLEQLEGDHRDECAEITNARLRAVEKLSSADAGSRHDTMLERTHLLVQLGAGGHTGVGHALAAVRQLWEQLTGDEGRSDELQRALVDSARKAVPVVGGQQVPRDPCLLVGGAMYAAPAPADDAGRSEGSEQVEAGVEADPVDQPISPARWWGVREAIGAQAFEPAAGLDQTLAEKVLERTYPVLRHAYDSRGWLLRVPDRWELHGDLTSWAVATVATLIPTSDDPDRRVSEDEGKNTDLTQLRARFMTAAGSRAIAGKMTALVTGGMHPAAVELARLDSQPDVLWAGGWPWSLTHSLVQPTLALLSPDTPHLHSAGVMPEARPTRLWDAFCAAVWPDAELRHWALRVLSICLTGYADRALPILQGETGRGKTQVVNLLMSVLGSYAHAADPRLLTQAGENAHASIVYALKGRRLSFIDEGPREGKVAQERLKQLSGGGELTANQMGQNPITFRPTHTLVMTTNDDPPLVDPAVRSRVRLIPCDGDPEAVRAARAAIGHLSGPAWRQEAPGVLASFMAHASAWLANPRTASVEAAPEGVRWLAENIGAAQDPIRVWVDEETEPSEAGTSSRELYQAFTASCLRNNLRRDAIPSETKWGRALTLLGYPSLHSRGGKRRGLKIRSGENFGPFVPPTPENFIHGAPERDGCDGSVTGSRANPSQTFPQVNRDASVAGDGCDGLTPSQRAHVGAHTHLSSDPDTTRHPSQTNRSGVPDLRKQGVTGTPGDPSPDLGDSRKPTKREQTDAAREAKAQAKVEKRAAAVALAAGAHLGLPAAVTRDSEHPGQVRLGVLSSVDAEAALATITETPGAWLTVDVEHTGYPVGHEHHVLRTVQLGNETFAVVLDPTDPVQAEVVRRHMAAASVLVAHSAGADLAPLEHAGLINGDVCWAKVIDTGMLAKLSDPKSTGNDADLKNLSRNVLGEHGLSKAADEARAALFKAGGWLTKVDVTTPVERSGWAQVDHASTTMVTYDASDVLDAALLARTLPWPEPAVLEREREVQRITARVTRLGIRLDPDHVQAKVAEHRSEQARCSDAVARFTANLGDAAIENPGAPIQVGKALLALGAQLDTTGKSGKPSVDKGVLEPLAAGAGQGYPPADLAKLVLDYRHHSTALNLLLEPYLETVTRGDGRARPTIFTLGADTGRMSSSRPNVQQVSREGGMRACFTADPGHLLISADFSSVEVRVGAGLSQDRELLAMILADDADPDGQNDLHWQVARLVFGPQATKAQRYKAKPMVFGRIYGSGVNGLARSNAVSLQVARAVIDALDALTPRLSAWSKDLAQSVEAGHTRYPAYSGRVIHLPTDRSYAAPNYAIQGTARELLVDALLRWRQTPWGEAPLFPVHDEVVAMVPEDQAEAATAALAQCMTTELYGVPIIASPAAPTYAWSDS